MGFRRREHHVASLDELSAEIACNGGTIRGYYYETTGQHPEIVSDFSREDTLVEDVIGVPGIFHRPEGFEDHSNDIVFVSEALESFGARVVTDEAVTGYAVSVLTRHNLGGAATAGVR